ncbi:hypothetical protein QQY66_00030 [Streptomyces sp. DG2A-72]|nr:hypothetical protein [Streptomyces sp. DG2A-72]MDO0930188.1 hypothetical protein [Streptomyces sp. DG2A-72]
MQRAVAGVVDGLAPGDRLAVLPGAQVLAVAGDHGGGEELGDAADDS